jgi:putative tricarboxylic transport membrane protein
MVGVYSSEGQWENLIVLLAISLVGWGLLKYDWPRAPFVIGLVLGRIAEESLHKALGLWGIGFFWRPLSLVLIGLILATIAYAVYNNLKGGKSGVPVGAAS